MSRKMLKLAVGSLILIAAGTAIILSLSSFVNPYVTVNELLQDPQHYQDDNIQLVGTVVSGSLSYEDAKTLFILQDFDDTTVKVEVKYNDIPPNGLQDNQRIVAIGQLHSDGEFEAHKLLMQCPSKYDA